MLWIVLQSTRCVPLEGGEGRGGGGGPLPPLQPIERRNGLRVGDLAGTNSLERGRGGRGGGGCYVLLLGTKGRLVSEMLWAGRPADWLGRLQVDGALASRRRSAGAGRVRER